MEPTAAEGDGEQGGREAPAEDSVDGAEPAVCVGLARESVRRASRSRETEAVRV